MVSVKAAATGRVSWGPMVSGLGPLEHPKGNTKSKKKKTVNKSVSLRPQEFQD